MPRAGGHPAQRPRAAVPHHHRGPRAELHSRLWPHHRLSRRHRLRHPARRRHRLFGRGHHPLLRSAAGEGHRLGADAGRGDRPHEPGAARVPHPRRGDQPHLPRSDHQPPDLPRQLLHHALHRHDAGAVRAGQAPGPRHQAAELSRRRHASTAIPRRAAGRSRSRRPQPRWCRSLNGAIPRRHQAAARPARPARTSPPGCAAQKQVLVTDTTMRDAHQSLLATRMRTHDIARIAGTYARALPRAAVARMLGRRDLRRRHALPHRGSVGAAGAGARGGAQPPAADAAARRQRRRLHQLSRQCRAALRQPGGRRRRRPVPRLRLPQLGREHARRDGRGARAEGKLCEAAICYTGDILDPDARQIRPQVLCRAGQGARGGRRAHHRASRTWPGC